MKLEYQHLNSTRATFEMPHKFKKNQKNLRFLPQVYMLSLHLLKKFQLKILIFDPYSKVSKTTKWYINLFESFMCMWAWGACGLALGKEVLGLILVGGD